MARDRPELVEQIDVVLSGLRDDPRRPCALRPAFRDRIFYAPVPLGRTGRVAFVFPGSGNDYPGMGRDLAVHWPEVLRRQDAENDYLRSQYLPDVFWDERARAPLSVRQRIFGQVTLGSLVCDVVRRFGVRADAVIGYSLGESAALFALRAWTDRDAMLRAMNASPLFVQRPRRSLRCGPPGMAIAARRRRWTGWRASWIAGRERCATPARACGGPICSSSTRRANASSAASALRSQALVERLGCHFLPLPETSTVHCPVVREVAEAYRDLHRLPTAPPPGVRFYSTALARSFELNPDSAAEAILAQALDTVDFPAVIEAAYRDGVRVFRRDGAGRVLHAHDRRHPRRPAAPAPLGLCRRRGWRSRSCCACWRSCAAERVPVDLSPLYGPETVRPRRPSVRRETAAPRTRRRFAVRRAGGTASTRTRVSRRAGSDCACPAGASSCRTEEWSTGEDSSLAPHCPGPGTKLAPLVTQTVAVREATGEAHAAYLRLSATLQRGLMDNLQFQARLADSILASGARKPPVRSSTGGLRPPLAETDAPRSPALDRDQCLEFAVGSIGRVLGPDFAAIDSHPTRVRLPDEPLMLVDRILTIEGEPRSLTSGRVVTEHDIQPGAWYLDGGRIPTCIAIEAGQADLFLSGYLGIDFQTRGLAVYRLLDAAVTFHRGLPRPGEVIRYDIRIERFFRQGDTYLFRFQLRRQRGRRAAVDDERTAAPASSPRTNWPPARASCRPPSTRRPRPGIQPDDAAELPPIGVESYMRRAARRPARRRSRRLLRAALRRSPSARRPAPARRPHETGRSRLAPRSQGRTLRHRPSSAPRPTSIRDAWFLTCHFVDDQVMPGTLMYECCLHTLRIYLLRLGWIAEVDGVVCEPVPGVASELKCRGQVTADDAHRHL